MSLGEAKPPSVDLEPVEARWKRVASRWGTRFFFLGLPLTLGAKVATAGGASPLYLTAATLLTSSAAIAAAVGKGLRSQWIDGWRLALLLVGLFYLPDVYPRVGGDGLEYYALLRSAWFDHDFDFRNDYAGLGARPVVGASGLVTARFPMGVSLFWSPAVLGVHGVVRVANACGAHLPVDGFAPLYQGAATLATYVYGFFALFLLETLLRRYYPPGVATLTALALFLVTPLFFYLVATPSMSHGVSVFACTLFVVAWWRARDDDSARRWAMAGLAAAAVVVVRGQDGVLVALALVDLVWRQRAKGWKAASALLGPPFVMGLAQILLWWHLYGGDTLRAVQYNGHLVERAPQVLDFLFAARHGVFTWTPLYVVAAGGWLLWWRRDRFMALLFWAGFAMLSLLLSTQFDWWGGSSFGQRRILGFTPLFALGLGEAFEFVRRRPLVLVTTLVAAAAQWNLSFAYIYNSELISAKTDAVSVERLSQEQVTLAYRTLLRWESRLPARVFMLLYDNLKGVWLDEGPRSLDGQVDLGQEPDELPMLLGSGWYPPMVEDNVNYRLSRGTASRLRIPVRTPGDFRLELRIKRARMELPVEVTVDWNGQTLGRIAPTAEWSVLAVTVRRDAVTPGFNDLDLGYSATPRRDLPGYRGKEAAVAVDWLRLERQAGSTR